MNRHINFHGKVRRWNHNLSYRNSFSGEFGELRPVWVEDGVPGDTFQYHPEARIYFAPLVFPTLASLKARIDVFFVPNRLAWTEWESFITGGPDNNLSPAYPSLRNIYAGANSASKSLLASGMPNYITAFDSLFNNLGHPYISGFTSSEIEKDPFDMILWYDYQFIYDEYYRDEEKQVSYTAPNGVRDDVYDIFQRTTPTFTGELKKIAWSKDYFTTASLEQQRGGDIPLLSNPMWKAVSGDLGETDSTLFTFPDGTMYASGDEEATVESVLTVNGLSRLRAAAAWLNNNVVGGTRYIEQLRSRYRVVSSDARLQRPEMVGSIELPVSIDVVTSTAATDPGEVDVYLGDRAGKMQIVGSGKTLTYSCEEFGYFIGIFHVAPKPAYFQGMRRNIQREDKFDFFMPEFMHVPQREIRNNEIYCDRDTLEPETGGVFGYTGQYNEYRTHQDEVHGEFQNTLLAWTMARKFSSLPAVDSSSFLLVDNDAEGNNRIFADPSTGPHIFGVINNIVVKKSELINREPHF